MRRHRILKGETVSVVTASSLAATLECDVTIRYDKPSKDHAQTDNWHWQFTTAATRIEQEFPSGMTALDDGEVVDAIGTALTVITQRGQTYVQCYIRSAPGGRVKDALFQDYIHATHPVPLDLFIPPGPVGGHGAIIETNLTDPAANAEYVTQAVPTGAIWKVRYFHGQLVQGITQTPQPQIQFRNGGSILGGGAAGALQAASTTVDYYAGIGLGSSGTNDATLTAGGAETFGLPDTMLIAGDSVVFLTLGLGANSNWGLGFLGVEEWVIVG